MKPSSNQGELSMKTPIIIRPTRNKLQHIKTKQIQIDKKIQKAKKQLIS